jgi:hypothetical protein
MGTDGENIANAFRQCRQVCQQVSLLLRTADEQMKKANWVTAKNSYAIADFSYSLFNPRQWIPTNLFRFYFNDKFPNLIACISVLITDHYDERYTITEPIVTGLRFDYGNERHNLEMMYEYWYSRYFGIYRRGVILK